MIESDLKSAILKALHAIGIRAWSNAQGGRKFRTGLGPGSADVIACVRLETVEGRLARFVAIEIKTPSGTTAKDRAALQASWRDGVNRVGGYACVARSVDEAVAHVRRAAEGGAA